jgi:hypothetical protein
MMPALAASQQGCFPRLDLFGEWGKPVEAELNRRWRAGRA